MSLRIRQIGQDSSWQDRGRPGYLAQGVPHGGPMDRVAFGWAARLAESSVALEVGPFGLISVAESDVSVVIVGAERPILVDREAVEGQGVVRLRGGQVLTLGYPTRGSRSYLALGRMAGPAGGWLGSVSGVAVARGDRLVGSGDLPLRRLAEPLATHDGPLRVLPGPQAELLSELLCREWKASATMDRTGIRLEGEPIPLPDLGALPSEPQVIGTVQLTVGGTPILIGPDGPTIGGYAKPAILTDASRDRMGQLKPGDTVVFRQMEIPQDCES